MRQIEINTFNQFLTDAGIRDQYMDHFTNSRVKKTDDINTFMSSVAPFDVFTDGFYSELMSDTEWQTAKNLWKEYLNERLPKSTYKFCMSCWQLLPIDSFPSSSIDKDGHSLYCKECKSPQTWLSKHPTDKPEGGLTTHECILLGDHIYLNMELSQLIRNKGFRHCGLRHQDDKLFFIFCEKSTERNLKYAKTGGVSIISQKLTNDVVKSMNVNFTDPIHLRVTTNKSLKPSAVTIEVLHCVSHDDYIKNPFTRKQQEKTVKIDADDDIKEPADVADFQSDERSCTTGYKFCLACGLPKPESEFYADRNTDDKLSRMCRKCVTHSYKIEQATTISPNTAILFKGQLFFNLVTSQMIKENPYRFCQLKMKQHDSTRYCFKISDRIPDKSPVASMFTSCDSSGITSLKDASVINDIINQLGLTEDHAYILNLTNSHVFNGNLFIDIQSCTPYYFRESIEAGNNNAESRLISVQGAEETNSGNHNNASSQKIFWNDFHLNDIVKELKDPMIQDHIPVDIKARAGATILWIIGEMKRVWEKQTQANTDLDKQDKSADNDPFKGVMRYLISDNPAQGLTAKFIKHYDNPDFKEGIDALESTFAKALKAVGWKLQRPVKVVHYEEF